MQPEACENARKSIGIAIKGLNSNTDGENILLTSFLSIIKPIFLIWLCGFSGYGVWLIMLIISIKGAFTGFSAGLIIRLYDAKGIALSAAGILPQHLIILPLMLFMCFAAIERTQMHRGRLLTQKNRTATLKYSALLIIAAICALLAAAVDSYVTSSLLKSLTYMIT